MHTGDDKNDFQPGDPKDESLFPQDSPDEEIGTELSEEELVAEMEPFTLADWKQGIPDYTAEEFQEKLLKPTRSIWMPLVTSCLFGASLGAAIAGVLVNNQPKPQHVRAFFIFFLVLAPLLSCVWYWFFVLRPESIAKKITD